MARQNRLEEIHALCQELKLPAFYRQFETCWADPRCYEMKADVVVLDSLKAEIQAREERREVRSLSRSNLRSSKAYHCAGIDNFIIGNGRGIATENLRRLAACTWVTTTPAFNVMISGSTGTGKTWLATTLGMAACQAGISTYYYRMPVFLEELQDAIEHHCTREFRARLHRYRLLILDDFGMGNVLPEWGSDLLSLFVEREQERSTILAGQLDPSEWYTYIGNNHVTEALIDRFVNSSYRIELKGDSLREGHAPV